MRFIYFYLAGLTCVGVVSGALLWRRRRRTGGFLPACAPLALYQAAAAVAFYALGGAEDDSWTSCILAVPLALSHGLNGYATLDSGSVQTLMYPPVWAAVYGVAGFATDPAVVTALAFVIAAVSCVVPVWIYCRAGGGDWALGACLVGLLAWAAWNTEPLWHVTYRVRPDAPALGFALLACAAAVMSKNGGRWYLPTALLLAWFSVWTKQVMAPLLFVLPLWIVLTQGRQEWKRLGGWWVATGAAVALPWLLWMPFDGLWLNLVTIPARCPWGGEWPLNIVRVAGELSKAAWLPLAILATGAAFNARLWKAPRPLLEFFASPPGLALLVAAVNVPVSLLGRVKAGGDPNTLTPTIYFLWAAAAVAIAANCRMPGAPSEAQPAAIRARAALGIALMLAIPAWGVDLMRSARQPGSPLGQNIDQQAYNFLRDTGRKVYFPYRPTAHLQASGSFYHAARAVYDREVQAGIPLSPKQIKEYFPAAPEAVCWEPRWGAEYVREKYFANYRRQVRFIGLDAFACFAAADMGAKSSNVNSNPN